MNTSTSAAEIPTPAAEPADNSAMFRQQTRHTERVIRALKRAQRRATTHARRRADKAVIAAECAHLRVVKF